MYDCGKEIRNFHNEEVKLTEKIRQKLGNQAEANEKRLKTGLQAAEEPAPHHFVIQGSYAMRTTVQHPDNDYDIDDGVVFERAMLRGKQGADKSALDARKMVCDALQDDVFKKKPEVRTNCVRVYYNEGHHVDVPVYRLENADTESTIYELASTDWKPSNPEGVTDWFNKCLKSKESVEEKGKSHQMRRLVRLLKKFTISRTSWNLPSGFVLTVLVNESYYSYNERDDEAFYDLIRRIKVRLDGTLVVSHPVLPETLTNTTQDANMVELRERLQWALEELQITQKSDCTRKAALKAWKSVFNTEFFDDLISEDTNENAKSFSILSATPSVPVDKQGGGRFG